MKSYFDLVDQTFDFPTKEFKVEEDSLFFNEIDLMSIIEEYGTPLKLTYLPRIAQNINRADELFASAFKKLKYKGDYTYCYCTKSSHFSFVIEECLRNGTHIETSSAFDIPIIKSLYRKGSLSKETFILCNGFKRPLYTQYVSEIINEGFNCIPILDNLKELDYYSQNVSKPFNVGMRLAADEEPNFEFYTSRLGIRYGDVIDYYKGSIKDHPHAKLKMLHYFINTGIRDSAYYWSELNRFVNKYCELKKIAPELDSIDIGGGFPIINSLHFDFDYQYMVEQIVENIKWTCDKNHVEVPHIFTEFGSYTVGESGAVIYSVLDQKLQNDKELWYMIDGSFITHLPDVWGTNHKYIMLPVNKWGEKFHRVNIGGLTCDSMDYYNSEMHTSEVFLPKIENGTPLYFGFFHTGAYQESLGGYGGIQHCLIPAPQHVIVEEGPDGTMKTRLFAQEQESQQMLNTLGYDRD